MSALDNLLDLQEQICYVQCGCCSTILLVNVPCSSLSMVVTVRCGHCTSILSVNMSKACLVPRHLCSSTDQQEDKVQPKCELSSEEAIADLKAANTCCPLLHFSSDEDENEDSIQFNQVIHKPPERKQRAPSAYNHFIKEEIKRLKIEHPDMTHKQAFSAAAKNWAHCPQSQHKGGGDTTRAVHLDGDNEVHHFGDGFHKKMASSRQSISPEAPSH